MTGFSADFQRPKQPTVCVLDASSYVGFWILKGLLGRGYSVQAAVQTHDGDNEEITRKIREMDNSSEEERLTVFVVDLLDYHSILTAVKGCSALFCSLDNPKAYDENGVEMEVRGTINVVEACAHTETVEKLVFSSSLAAAIWRANIRFVRDVDERSWSDADFCRKHKLWYALAKTLSEQSAWALAMDRMVNMVSINAGLVLGPAIANQNPATTMSYLRGAAQMQENGVLAWVDVAFLADVHIRALEDASSTGRYFCFNEVVDSEDAAVKLAESLSPLISVPSRYGCQDKEAVPMDRLRKKKLAKLIKGPA